MTIEQTIEIPVGHRLTLDIPPEIPAGRARITITPETEMLKTAVPLLSLRGSCKGLDTMDAYFVRKRADKDLEDRNRHP